ncbi:hypothetical protein JBL43_11300 [Aureibaculum sp. A20]|uniref:Uncharacterized protein n=1 Tax=Aureibaculum flavum TaxID=2795986 RepID=A0ABS0WS71_9FLAO|nr:hypothetical protein [Aureibaculum flavum]MBJ2174826.1 hypothetical protein [Aureibaculum flavum]
MENENVIEVELDTLSKLSETELKSSLEVYKSLADMETYVKLPFLGIGILVLIHNVFLAGKSYELSTYNTIMNTEMTIGGILLLIVFTMAGIAISKTSKLKNEIKQYGKKHHIKKQILAEEFSLVATQLYGGSGIKIK